MKLLYPLPGTRIPLVETPEQIARKEIDKALVAAGWVIQDAKAANLHAGRGVAVREAPLAKGHGFADYLLYVDQRTFLPLAKRRNTARMRYPSGPGTS